MTGSRGSNYTCRTSRVLARQGNVECITASVQKANKAIGSPRKTLSRIGNPYNDAAAYAARVGTQVFQEWPVVALVGQIRKCESFLNETSLSVLKTAVGVLTTAQSSASEVAWNSSNVAKAISHLASKCLRK